MNQFQLPARRDLFYGGAWHQATGGTAANVSPSTGQELGSFAVAGAEDVDRAVAAARAGFAEWRRVAPLERARVLREMGRRPAEGVATRRPGPRRGRRPGLRRRRRGSGSGRRRAPARTGGAGRAS